MRRLIIMLMFIIVISGGLAYFFFRFPNIWGEALLPYPYREIYKAAWEEQKGRGCNMPRHFPAAVGFVESGHNPRALSRAGARGIGQFLPGTAFAVSRKYNLGIESIDDLHDPAKSIRSLAYYACDLMIASSQDLDLTNARYNFGPRAVNRDLWPRETINHVRKVRSALDAYNSIYGPNDEGPPKQFATKQPTPFVAAISLKNLYTLLIGAP